MKEQRQIDELYSRIDYLRNNYDLAQITIKKQRKDIKRFLLLLIEKDIPIPEDLINRYINKVHLINTYDEELPFD